jgi:hypothetical protein
MLILISVNSLTYLLIKFPLLDLIDQLTITIIAWVVCPYTKACGSKVFHSCYHLFFVVLSLFAPSSAGYSSETSTASHDPADYVG